jgi:hypothetical protein
MKVMVTLLPIKHLRTKIIQFFKESVMLTYFLRITGNIRVIWISKNMQSYESICGKMPKKLLSR